MRVARIAGVLGVTACVLVACGDDAPDEALLAPPPLGAAASEEELDPGQVSALARWVAVRASQAEENLCWRESYGRGAGEPLSTCRAPLDRSGLLCYPECEAGYYGIGPVCWEECRDGYSDDGLTCRKDARIFDKASYGRGAGYADWEKDRCERESGKCERYGAMWYPTCDSGYEPIECCICRKKGCPSGYKDDGAFCRKDASIYFKDSYGRGAGEPMKCGSGTEQSGALCYPPCKPDYDGVGPVCWHECPSTQPFVCGAACAKSEGHCAAGIAKMILAPIELVENIVGFVVSGGTLNAAKATLKSSLKAAAKEAGKAAVKTALRQSNSFSELTGKLAVIAGKQIARKFGVQASETVVESAAEHLLVASLSHEDPEMADLLGDLDPTGVAAIVDAFNHPICVSDDVPDVSRYADAMQPSNLARRKPATQSSTEGLSSASRAVDGNPKGSMIAQTRAEDHPFWEVDLRGDRWIGRVVVHRVAQGGVTPDLRVTLRGADGRFLTSRVLHDVDHVRGELHFTMPARYVRVERVTPGVLALSEVEAHEHELASTFKTFGWIDLAAGMPVTQSSTGSNGAAVLAVDGDPTTRSMTKEEANPTWQVDLGANERIENVVIEGEASDVDVVLLDASSTEVERRSQQGPLTGPTEFRFQRGGRYVRVERRGSGTLSLASVEVRALRPNHALAKDVQMSSELSLATFAGNAVDGEPTGRAAQTRLPEYRPWIRVDLGKSRAVSRVRLRGADTSLASFDVTLFDYAPKCVPVFGKVTCTMQEASVASTFFPGTAGDGTQVNVIGSARFVKIQLRGVGGLRLNELEVF